MSQREKKGESIELHKVIQLSHLEMGLEKEKDSPLEAEVDGTAKWERSSKSTARCKVPVGSVSTGCTHWGTTEGDQDMPLWHMIVLSGSQLSIN